MFTEIASLAGWLVDHSAGHNHSLAGDPHPARVRARRHFPAGEAVRHERTRADFPDSNRGSDGQNGPSRRDD
jgi:hypothetical protein